MLCLSNFAVSFLTAKTPFCTLELKYPNDVLSGGPLVVLVVLIDAILELCFILEMEAFIFSFFDPYPYSLEKMPLTCDVFLDVFPLVLTLGLELLMIADSSTRSLMQSLLLAMD